MKINKSLMKSIKKFLKVMKKMARQEEYGEGPDVEEVYGTDNEREQEDKE